MNHPTFISIRNLAKEGFVSEYCLRQMEKRGELPCIYSGNRCLVNYYRFLELVGCREGDRNDRT